MKIPKPFLFLFAAILALGAFTPSHARAQVSVSFFYDNLDPYGEWVQDPDYGYCWHPTNVSDDWAPYTDGYWAYTDGGWTWVSYEDYGGIVYHYGRWAHLPGEGWVWVPGTTWAPAWVSWRVSDDYVGWAPLPPEARWRVGIGFGGWVDARFDIGPSCYSFVNVGDFGAPALGAVILHRDQNVTIINRTTNITNITVNNSNVYTGGPSYSRLAARSTRPIPTLKLVRQGDAAAIHGANGKILSRQQGNSLVVLAPKVTAPASGKYPAPHKVARTLTGVTPDHGWDGVKDPQQRADIESKFKTEAGTATPAAKPVNPEDVKLVTEKTRVSPTPKPFTTEAVPKAKTPKNRPVDTATLENAPATEEPGVTTPAATPKSGKTKKSHAYEPAEGVDNGMPAATAEPKPKKSKKAKTPAEDESGAYPPETTKKASSGDSNLQPFMSGDTEEPKAKKAKTPKSEYSEEPTTPKSEYSEEPTAPQHTEKYSEEPGGPQGPGPGEKPEKEPKKNKKGKAEPSPQQ
jgi:hypothetical protein